MLDSDGRPPTSPAPHPLVPVLRELGVTHVVTLPDNTSASLLEALAAEDPSGSEVEGGEAREPGVQVVFATREGEAVSLASGLWLGGASPVVLIQNTGLLEAGDGLRGTASRMGAPLLLLVTCRGYRKARGAGLEPGSTLVDGEILVRPDVDSVAFMTEPTLDAWGIPHLALEDDDDAAPLKRAWRRAHDEERPVALLLDT